MYRFRKILSILLLFVMLIPFVPDGALVFDAKAATEEPMGEAYPWGDFGAWGTSYWNGTDSVTNLTGKPGIYIMGDGYAIIWVTSFNGTGTVVFKDTKGNIVSVSDKKTGIIRTNDTIHVVKLTPEQYACVQKNGYYIVSRQVTSHEYAVTHYGTNTVKVGPIKVAATPTGTKVNTVVLTDIHGKYDQALNVAKQFKSCGDGDPDLYIFPGDLIADTLAGKYQLENIFKFMGNITSEVRGANGAQVPAVYVRGNHECRGIASTMLLEYLPTKTGQFYFDFTYGSLWGVVIDTTEDKAVTHRNYGNPDDATEGTLANFEAYLVEQQKWLRSIKSPTDSSVKIKLGIYHVPNLADCGGGTVDLSNSVHHLGLDFAVSGHDHTVAPKFTIANVYHDTIVCGGSVTSGYVYTTSEGITTNHDITTHYADEYYGKYVGTRLVLNSDTKRAENIVSRFDDGRRYGRKFTQPNTYWANKTGGSNGFWLFDGGKYMSFPADSRTADNTRNMDKYSGQSGYTSGVGFKGYYGDYTTKISPDAFKDTNFKPNGNLPVEEVKAGTVTSTVKGSTAKVEAIRIAVKPVVFETGGDWYNVVWVTDLNVYDEALNGGGNGAVKGVIGFVQYVYQGKTYQVFDEVAGFRRSYDNIHTVKIPKEHLSNNEYFVGSVTVTYQYENSSSLSGRYYKVGQYYTTSEKILFLDKSEDKTPNLLTYADLKYPTNKLRGFVEEAREALGTAATYVVVAGNAVETTTGNRHPGMEEVQYSNYKTHAIVDPHKLVEGEALSYLTGIIYNDPLAEATDKGERNWTKNFHQTAYYNAIPSLIDACRDASHGSHPVIFSRGANECRGMFATDLIRYLPTVTGEFYYTVNIGDYTYVNMDTNEDGPTGQKASLGGQMVDKYDGRIDPDQLKRDLDEYLTDVFGGVLRDGTTKTGKGTTDAGEALKDKLIVISNLPLGTMDDRTNEFRNVHNNGSEADGLGAQWQRYLKQHGAIINLARSKLPEDPGQKGLTVNDLFVMDRDVSERKMFLVRSGGYIHPNEDTSKDSIQVTSVATSVLISPESAHIATCFATGTKDKKSGTDDYHTKTGSATFEYVAYTVSLATGEDITYSAEEPDKSTDGKTYYLSTPSHLVWLSEQVQDNINQSGKKFVLQNDIDLMLKPFTPIGGYNDNASSDAYNGSDYFAGTFDGQGYKIKNLHILPGLDSSNSQDKYNYFSNANDKVENEVGLFGAVKGGTIINLTVEGGFIKGAIDTGALIGNITTGTVTNCYSNVAIYGPGGTSGTSTYGASRMGGLIGQATLGVTITQCANYGNVFQTRPDGSVGGLVGALYSNKSGSSNAIKIHNCYNRGHVISDQVKSNVGGIFGYTGYFSFSLINCYNASAVMSKANTYDGAQGKIGAIWGGVNTDDNRFYGTFEFFNCYYDPSYNVCRLNGSPTSLIGRYAINLTGIGWLTVGTNDKTYYGTHIKNITIGTNQPALRNSVTLTTDSETLRNLNKNHTPYDGYVADGSKNYANNTSKSAGKINDGYPIHSGLKIYQDKLITVPDNYNATTDAMSKVNNGISSNVNDQFASDGANITNLLNMKDGTMYVLLQSADSTSKYLYSSGSGTTMSLTNAKGFVWQLKKSGSSFTLTNYNTQTSKSITLKKGSGTFYDSNSNDDSNNKDNLYTLSGGVSGSWHIFPLLQDNVATTYGYTGSQHGGISSVISSLSVASAHKADRDAGLADVKYNSVFGNNIFYYQSGTTNSIVLDTHTQTFRQPTAPYSLISSYMTAPDATGQLMDMACYDQMYWDISPSNKADLELSCASSSTFGTDSEKASTRFFVAYSLNADGGYYLIPLSGGGQVVTVGKNATNITGSDKVNVSNGTVSTHSLALESFANTSRARFWIQPDRTTPIKAEIVDVLVRFDRNGKIIDNSAIVKEQSRSYTILYENSMTYNPNGFWTDIYDGYVYAFDSVDVVSENNIVCYRYFRPKVFDVTISSNLVSATYTDDSKGRAIRYYADQRLDATTDGTSRFTRTFKVSFNSNGGSEVDPKTYEYTLASWTYKAGSKKGIPTTAMLSDIATLTTDHQNITLLAEWSSAGLTYGDEKPTRDKHAFYGWSTKTAITEDGDLSTSIGGVTAVTSGYPVNNDKTVINAFWVGGDFAGVTDVRTDDKAPSQSLNAVAAIYGATKQSGNFATMKEKAEFKWYSVKGGTPADAKGTISGTYNSNYTPSDALKGDDRGSAIKAQLYYKDTIVTGAYAYSALIPTNQLVDAVIDDDNQKAHFEKINVTAGTNSGTKTYTIGKLASGKYISGVTTTLTGITYKVYGKWGSEKILIVDNGRTAMYQDGGVSYEGVEFDSYEVEITGSATISNNNFQILVNPHIYKLTIDESQSPENKGTYIEYKAPDYKTGQRAQQDSTKNRYFYDDDQIRVYIPSANGFKLAAGTHFVINGLRANENGDTVDNVKVFPTYTTTSTAGTSFAQKVMVDKINGIDVILKKQGAGYIKFGTKDMTITVVGGKIDNATKGENLYQNINIGPMGVKRTNDGTKKIRFGTIWYLDDLVTENRWYRAYTQEDENAFGTYVIRLQKLFDNGTVKSDFYNYVNGKNSALVTKWKTKYASVTEEEKQEVLGYLKDFIAQWNAKADSTRVDMELSFGTRENGSSVAAKVGADYYYYYKGDLSNGVREAMVEYSAVLEIPSGMENEEFIYIPYASYVYDWNYGYFANFEQYPQNIYVYSAPTAIYKYNGSN